MSFDLYESLQKGSEIDIYLFFDPPLFDLRNI